MSDLCKYILNIKFLIVLPVCPQQTKSWVEQLIVYTPTSLVSSFADLSLGLEKEWFSVDFQGITEGKREIWL